MKKLLPGVAAVVAALVTASGNPLFAQSFAGTWQAIVQSPQAHGGQFRAVIKITTTQSDGPAAILYNIDRSGQAIKANTVSLQGANVRFSLAPLGATYEGTLSADGNTIAGTWHAATSQPLTFARATSETAWTIPEAPPPLREMPPDADPSFEVATIRPSLPDARGTSTNVEQNGMTTIRNKSLTDIITFAYNLHSRQLKGLPDGLASERFDIEAKTDTPGQPNDRQFRSMLQKLIADRFMLASHREKKEMSVYTITVAKSGPKLTKTQFSGNLPSENGSTRTTFTNATIADLAAFLQGFVLDRPVVDQSGLEGRFDFALNWTPDETQYAGNRGFIPASDPNAEIFPDLFTAMQQQLGLKLESTKAPVDVLVIDHVEKPSEN